MRVNLFKRYLPKVIHLQALQLEKISDFTSTFVQDAFYIMRKVFIRAVAVCEADLTYNLFGVFFQILDTDILRVTYQKITTNISVMDTSKENIPQLVISAVY